MKWIKQQNLNSCYCHVSAGVDCRALTDWILCDAAWLELHWTAQHLSLQILLCVPVLYGSLTLEREGQIELEGMSEKGGGTLPTGHCWRKIFWDVLATRSTMQVYHYLFNLPKLRCWFNNSLPTIPSDCPKSSIISLLADCLIELVSLCPLSSLSLIYSIYFGMVDS